MGTYYLAQKSEVRNMRLTLSLLIVFVGISSIITTTKTRRSYPTTTTRYPYTTTTTRYPYKTTTTRHPYTTTTRYPYTTTTRYPYTTTTRYPYTTTTRYPYTTTTRYPYTTTTTRYPYTTTTVPAGECPDDWIESPEGCFLFHYTVERITWREAQIVCEDLGGFLVEVRSQDQQTFLEIIAALEEEFTGSRSWFIGLTDSGHEGRWIWEHSIEDADYTSWAPGYPRNYNSGDDCAALSSREGYKWTDVSCEETFGSPICGI